MDSFQKEQVEQLLSEILKKYNLTSSEQLSLSTEFLTGFDKIDEGFRVVWLSK